MMKMKKVIAAACAAVMAVSQIPAAAADAEGADDMELTESGAYVGSKVIYSGDGYERDEALEVAGEPFFYNGVQIRIDKVVDDPDYNFTDEQVEELFKIAKEDGCGRE